MQLTASYGKQVAAPKSQAKNQKIKAMSKEQGKTLVSYAQFLTARQNARLAMDLMDFLDQKLSVCHRVKIFVVQLMSSVRLLSSLDRRFTNLGY